MGTSYRPRLENFKPLEIVFPVCVFLLVTAVSSTAQTFTTLFNFNQSNGVGPVAPLVQGADGNFYGTAPAGGGPNNYGTVFKMTPSGTLTTLYTFCSQNLCADGYGPAGGLLQATDGNFYGTTQFGANGFGTVFKITPAGALTTLHAFQGTDGAVPLAGLVQGSDGNFYGTTSNGGAYSSGAIFKITPSGTLSVLYSFCAHPVGGVCPDGFAPWYGPLLQGSDGNFYGTTGYGGNTNQFNCSPRGCGTIFKITPGGILTTLYSFCLQSNCADGATPLAGLIQATDGNFYGTTAAGGGGMTGTVFRITPAGTFTCLYGFGSGGDDGARPTGKLVQAADGNLYGTTSSGNANLSNSGTIFVITPAGNLTTLYDFCPPNDDPCPSGSVVIAGLVQAADGSFYGATTTRGAYGYGTIFRLTVALVPTRTEFVPVTPCRLLDTRPQSGGHGPIQGGTSQSFNLPQLAQANGCAALSSALAYSLNVTVVPHGPLGYLTIWPTGENQPYVSTMNSYDGRTKANATIVPAGTSGAVDVYVSNTTDVVLDIDGYFTTPIQLQSYPFSWVTPCRVVDTRNPDGELGGPYLRGGTEREFPILGSQCLQGAGQPVAYSLNITVVPHVAGQRLQYLTVWGQGEPRPNVSTLNNPTATAVANAAIVQAGTNGAIAVFPSNDTDLIVDVNGFFGDIGQFLYYPVAPCRLYDSRNNNGPPFSGELTVPVLGSPCATPAEAGAYVFNATVVPSGPLGYLTLWADGGPQPYVSTLNAYDHAVTSNMAIVPNLNGSTDAYASNPTQLILDILGYFAP